MKKFDILSAILTALEGVTVANGYQTDIGENATYAQDTNHEYDTAGVDFRDTSCEVVEVNQYHEYALGLEVQAIAFGEDLLELGCQLEQDLIQAIGADPTWDALALKTEFAQEGAIVKDWQTAGKKAVSLTLNLIVTFRTEKWTTA